MSFRGDGKRYTLKSKSTLFIYLFSIDKIDQLILIRRAPLKKFWNSDADENYAYCEFFEGSTIDGDEEHEAYYFKEYYDLDDDPYQLDNIYDQLGMEQKNIDWNFDSRSTLASNLPEKYFLFHFRE